MSAIPEELESEVLELVKSRPDLTIQDIADRYTVSRGSIHAIQVKHGALRNQPLRDARKKDELARLKDQFHRELLGKVVQGTVLDYLDTKVPAGSVDLIVTSPPYNIGKNYGDDDAVDRESYTVFKRRLLFGIHLMLRSLKEGGVLALNVGTTRDYMGRKRNMASIIEEDILEDPAYTLMDTLVWTKAHGLPNQHGYANRYEHVLVIVKGQKPAVWRPERISTPQSLNDLNKRSVKGPNKGKLSCNVYGAGPTNVQDFGQCKAGNGERTGHPAQFPEALVRHFVNAFTELDDIVLDPFMGSGTTGAAAKALGRRFAGCDLFYADDANKRIQATNEDTVFTFPGMRPELLELKAREHAGTLEDAWRAPATPVNDVFNTLDNFGVET